MAWEHIMRLSRTASTTAFVAGFLLAGAPAGAEERFVTVLPGESPGTLVVTVTGNKSPSVWIDGEATPARFESAGNGAVRAVISDLPSGSSLLGTGSGKPVAAIPLRAARPEEAPFNDRVVYHIMLGYFANGTPANDRAGMRRWIHRRYAGGDLQGVLSKADYLGSLGITDVWLSPVFQSETSHGYDVQNYYRIGDSRAVPGDPDASLNLFRELARTLGDAGVGIILDLPLDYGAGTYDRRAGDPNRLKPRSTKARQEAEKVWESWGTGFKYWNMRDEDTREFLREVALHWAREEGVSGFRMDYVRGVDHAFWAEIYRELKAERPDLFVFGEAWQDAHGPGTNMGDIAKYYEPVDDIGPQFDSLIEFPMKIVMTDVFARDGDARQLERWLQSTEQAYRGHGHPIYFIDSHDMSRFSDWAVDRSDERLLAAVTFMATLRGPMILFYGTETGLAGGKAAAGFDDSGRIPMPWDALNEDLIQRMTAVINMKRDLPVLQRGARWPLLADANAVVMARANDTTTALVAVNTSTESRTVEFQSPAPGALWAARLDGPVPVSGTDNGMLSWTLPALATVVAVAQ